MTTFLRSPGTNNAKNSSCTTPTSSPRGMDIPKELLQKAAESALISSFVGINLHPIIPTPPSTPNGIANNGSTGATTNASIITTTTTSSSTTSKTTGSTTSLNSNSSKVKPRPHHPGQTHKVVIEIDLDKEGSSSPSHSATSFFVKSIPIGGGGGGTCARALKELAVYEYLVPELYPNKSTNKRSPQTTTLTLPHCFLTHETGSSPSSPTTKEGSGVLEQRALLFLENLKVSGFRPCDPSDAFDFNHALLGVETLARFHAQSYFLIRQLGSKAKGRLALGSKFPFLLPNQKSVANSKLIEKCASVYASFFEQIVLPVVEGDNPSLSFKLRRKIQNPEGLYQKMGEILENEKYENDDLYVVCHGDFRMEHLLFRYDSGSVVGEEPVECRMVDLKNVRLAPLASDLVYFMFTSLSQGMREDFEEKLIAFYCDSFEAQLKLRYRQEGSELKEEDFDIEDFHRKVEDQYRRMLEFGFYASVTALPLIYSGLNTGVLENLGEVYLGGAGDHNNLSSPGGCGPSVLDSLQNSDKFAQLAKECLNSGGLRESITGVVKRLVKARIF